MTYISGATMFLYSCKTCFIMGVSWVTSLSEFFNFCYFFERV
uniref:Uncharacterized protein n=1 Tax=Arundo donax TaxID=35708 RepID=A0A0A9CDF8_ARUDO